jgi:hypothetical protein
LRALILNLEPSWTSVARLPAALAGAGFHTGLMGFPGAIACESSAVADRFLLSPIWPRLGGILRAMDRWRPDIIIPADSEAFRLLRFIAARPGGPARLRQVIDASLGAPLYRAAWGRRQEVQGLAAAAGIRIPPGRSVATVDDALAFASRHGYPVMLKLDDTDGGLGVAACANEEELRKAFGGLPAEVASDPSRRQRLRGFLMRRLDGYPGRRAGGLSIQAYVAGTPAMSCFVARQGQVYAGLTATALQTAGPRAPSTVVRLAGNDEIGAATEAFARRVGFSGIGGLDFIVSHRDGRAYMTEFNPRPIPIFHLGARVGVDLAAGLREAWRGTAPRAPSRAAVEERVIPLFPQEWYRDPESEWLAACAEDIPLDDPMLLAACVAGRPRTEASAPGAPRLAAALAPLAGRLPAGEAAGMAAGSD